MKIFQVMKIEVDNVIGGTVYANYDLPAIFATSLEDVFRDDRNVAQFLKGVIFGIAIGQHQDVSDVSSIQLSGNIFSGTSLPSFSIKMDGI